MILISVFFYIMAMIRSFIDLTGHVHYIIKNASPIRRLLGVVCFSDFFLRQFAFKN